MSWYEQAVIYQIRVRSFADASGDGIGDFAGLRQKVDYLAWLGVDAVWLMPFYPSPLRDDGYDVADYTATHPDYGTLDELRAVIDALHERGIRVITDLVMNHTSDEHHWFQEARRSTAAPRRDYYVWRDDDRGYADIPVIFYPRETSNWAYDAGSGQYYWHRFFSSQPDLNYDHPPVQAAMLEVLRFWLAAGVDGFRVDAVPYLFEREGTTGENLPETHAYLRRLRALIDAEYPHAALLAEANPAPADLPPYFETFNMCFHFPLMPRLYLALAEGDRRSIINILAQMPALPPDRRWALFLRNHDELTLQTVTPQERRTLIAAYSSDPAQILNAEQGLRRRLAPLMGNDRRKILLLHSLLYTLPGTPVMYYGDEIGMGEDMTLDDRYPVRTPMQWDSTPNGGFSSAPAAVLAAQRLRVLDDAVYGYTAVNVAAQQADPHSLLHQVRALLHARRQQPALHTNTVEFVDSAPAVLACWRSHGPQRLLAVHHLAEGATTFTLPAGRYRDVLTGAGGLHGALPLDGYGFRWLAQE